MIRVILVDDSEVQRELITHILEKDPMIQLIETAVDGEEGVKKILSLQPDIVLMDIHLPKMNGIEATRIIMSTKPVPIVIITSSCLPDNTMAAIEALDAGALTIIDKNEVNLENPSKITDVIKTMSEVKVVKRYQSSVKQSVKQFKKKLDRNPEQACTINLVAIGASTGGPNTLNELFLHLKSPLPPILVVQHITSNFLEGLVEWLTETTKHNIKIAKDKESIKPNTIYFAPNDYQMGINSLKEIQLIKTDFENGHIPAASFLFKSVAEHAPKNSLGILLTGMGRDGADGLKMMKERGAQTIAQDKQSSIIFGMPAEAIAIGGADYIMNPIQISEFINRSKHE